MKQQPSLELLAGCSACACGIVEACPGYINPTWYIVLGIVTALAITLLALVLFVKKFRKKPTVMTLIALSIAAVVISGGLAYKYIDGNRIWQTHMDNYQSCLDNPNRTMSCEY